MLAGVGETDEDAGLKEIDLLIASPNPGISVLSIRRSFFTCIFVSGTTQATDAVV